MKILRLLILGGMLMVAVGRAQITDSGWYNTAPRSSANFLQPDNSSGPPLQTTPPAITAPMDVHALLIQQSPTNVAEIITPDIQALADGLQDDPLKIYNYVHDHIRFVLYFGSKKGANLTLLEKSGNDFDQSALLVALLRAAGYNATYNFGWMEVPYDATDGSHNDLHHWLQLNLTNSNWNTTSNYLFQLFYGIRGYPTLDYLSRYVADTNTFLFQRVWVTATINTTNYYFDPAFKVSEPVAGINLPSAAGVSSNSLLSAAGGTSTANYCSGLSEANLQGTLTSYATNLANYIQSNAPNSSVAQIVGGWQIVPATNTALPLYLSFQPVNYPSFPAMNITNWINEPTNLMTSMNVTFSGTNVSCYTPQLLGARLALTFDTNGTASFWQDDVLQAQHATSGSSGTTNVVLFVSQPFGNWNYTNNTLILDPTFANLNVTNAYQRTNATYALTYAFEPDWGWLQERQTKLDNYRLQGLADTSRQVISETLNVMGMNWMLQTENAGHLLEPQLGILPQFHLRLGRMAQEAGHGYYVDVYMQQAGFFSNAGATSANNDQENRDFDLFTYFGSALENGIIEQLQNTNLVGASTVKMLEIANTNGQAVYLANSANWSSIQGSFANYGANLTSINSRFITQGYNVLMPQNGSNHVAGAGSWAGYGYVGHLNVTNGLAITAFTISGNYNGAYSASSTATVTPAAVALNGDSQTTAFGNAPAGTANPTGADPVDMADGTFQVEHTDLSLGQTEPRGITLSRYYNGTRRNSNPAGIAAGWVHNYYLSANAVSAPQAALGGTTPVQSAAMIAATSAAINLYNDASPNPKNWMVTALIAKWGIDQLTKGSEAVTLGKDTVQFIRQPNGVFTPPANTTMSLTQNGSLYSLQQRHGNTFNFNAAGQLNTIVDPYNNTLTATYTNGLIKTLADWKGRSLTFNYTGSQLTSVADNNGRSIYYGYSSQGDLNSFTDAESKTSTYLYDTNHQITATFDALNQLVVSNVYDGLGHVAFQYTQGAASKLWRIFWSAGQTIEQDPTGSQRIFLYDNLGRFIGLRDQLNNLTKTVYDGQNHVVATISPLNETNRFIYDANNNLIYSVDPLGFTNQFVYDSQNNLIRSVDARGNPTTFGYNAQFSLTGKTNAAGDFVNYTYNTDGTLHTRTDVGGTTTFGYDSYGLLNSTIYPNSLGSESFVNSTLGDPSSHTDANGNTISFYYNARRELTNSVAPTNLTSKIVFDAVGNVAATIDSRNNVVSNTWSATRHLLATTLPATPQGVPVVTNGYDLRDWLGNTADPLKRQILYTNDLTGRVISATDPLLRTTRFAFDADGRKLTGVNAGNETNSQSWDARSSLIQMTDGAGHFSTRAYDAAGNQIILTNRNGNKWQFQFDAANRLTNTITPLGRKTSVSFNHQGLPATVTDPANQPTSLYYDGKGRLTNRADHVASTFYGYDANNNPTNINENGQINSWTYDAYNRVSAYRDTLGNLIQYRFDASGNVTNLIYPGGKNVYYAFDSLNRLTNVVDWSGRRSSIAYDLNNHITSLVRPNGSYRTIGYDAAGEATNIMEQMSNSLPIAIFNFNWTNTGTMAWEFAAPLPHVGKIPSRNMTYDADNRLFSFEGQTMSNYQMVGVDSDGNLTNGPLNSDIFAVYSYDARNRLLNAGGVTNFYDAANNRISQTFGTNITTYVVNPVAKLPQVLMRIENGVTNYYIYGAGLMYQVTETAAGTNTLTYHFDYRGSTVAMSADNGQVTDRIEYSAYGLTTYRVGNSDTPFLFNGRYGVQTDSNGLLYMRARYYNPYLCRFINADPSGFGGGLNHYAYAHGNPVSLLDPFGLNAQSTGDNNLSWIMNQPPAWVQDAQQEVAAYNEPTYQKFANFIPFAGDLVRGTRSAWNGDVELTDQISQSLLAQGALGLISGGMGRLGAGGASGLVHLTDEAGFTGINQSESIIGRNGVFAVPDYVANESTAMQVARTGLTPSRTAQFAQIPQSAQGLFQQPVPIGPYSAWKYFGGVRYAPPGSISTVTGAFSPTSSLIGPSTLIYGPDVLFYGGTAAAGGLYLYGGGDQ